MTAAAAMLVHDLLLKLLLLLLLNLESPQLAALATTLTGVLLPRQEESSFVARLEPTRMRGCVCEEVLKTSVHCARGDVYMQIDRERMGETG